jgi:hypothetical protein
MNNWSSFLSHKPRIYGTCLLALAAICASILFSSFMIWNEARPGHQWQDPILSLFNPIEASLAIGLLTNGTIAVAMIVLFRRPYDTVYFFFAALCIIVLRTMTLYFVPLEPPATILPLADPILETTFYGGRVLLKDLFFSGHTANLMLVGFLVRGKPFKASVHCIALLVGCLLILQHVHYFADVAAAPFFAIIAYKGAVWLGNHTLLRGETGHCRDGSIFSS